MGPYLVIRPWSNKYHVHHTLMDHAELGVIRFERVRKEKHIVSFFGGDPCCLSLIPSKPKHTHTAASSNNDDNSNNTPQFRRISWVPTLPSAVSEALIFLASSKVSPTQWLRPRLGDGRIGPIGPTDRDRHLEHRMRGNLNLQSTGPKQWMCTVHSSLVDCFLVS